MASSAKRKWTPRKSTASRQIFARVSKFQKVTGCGREVAEDVMRQLVVQVSDQHSTKQLDQAQLRAVLHELDARILEHEERNHARRNEPLTEGRPTTREGREEAGEDSDSTVTVQQSRTLLLFAEALGWEHGQLRSWIQGRMANVCGGRPWPQTRGEAIKLHEGLEAMLVRRPAYSHKAVLARAKTARSWPTLTEWEVGFLDDVIAHKGDPDRVNRDRGNKYRSFAVLLKVLEIELSRNPEQGS